MNAIEIRNLSKSYPGFMLDNINLTLPSGCIMGLIGENGAGKTTTLKLILDMIRRDHGSITILGRDNQDNLKLTKEDIGVVFDEMGFPEALTAKQLSKVMANTYRAWNQEVYDTFLQRFGLPERKQYKTFSHGMKMKLALAVALSHEAKLLILDEATSSMDPVARDEVMDLFEEFTRDESHSILFSSHIVSDLEKICDYIAFLHQGKLLLCEEKDTLLERYAFVNGTAEEFSQLPAKAVLGKRTTSYGVEAVALRSELPSHWHMRPVTIEELFVVMVKGERG